MVMAEEGCDRTARSGALCGEGQGVTDAMGDARPHRVMKTRARMGVPGGLRDGVVVRRRPHPRGDGLWVGRAPRVRAGHRRQRGPPRLRTVVTAVAYAERQDVPRWRVHGTPDPWLLGLRLHAVPPLVGCHLQVPDHHLPWGRHEPHRERIRQGHEPPETDANHTAHPMQGDVPAAQAFHTGAVRFDTHPVVGVQDQLAAACLAWIVLLAMVSLVIFLAWRGGTRETRVSHAHGLLRTSLVAVSDAHQPYPRGEGRAFPGEHDRSLAQFHHPELGGSGQWRQGGMTMVGDMFHHALQAKVDDVCAELARLFAQQPSVLHAMSSPSPSQRQGGRHPAGPEVSLCGPAARRATSPWWPTALGRPSSRGAQLRAMLVQSDIPVFTAEIPNRVAFDKASAEGVPVYGVDGDDVRAKRAWVAYESAGKEIAHG